MLLPLLSITITTALLPRRPLPLPLLDISPIRVLLINRRPQTQDAAHSSVRGTTAASCCISVLIYLRKHLEFALAGSTT